MHSAKRGRRLVIPTAILLSAFGLAGLGMLLLSGAYMSFSLSVSLATSKLSNGPQRMQDFSRRPTWQDARPSKRPTSTLTGIAQDSLPQKSGHLLDSIEPSSLATLAPSCVFSLSKTPMNQSVTLHDNDQAVMTAHVTTTISIHSGPCHGIILHERFDIGMQVASLLPEGCGLWPTMPGVLQCTWGDTLRAGNTLTFATRSLVTVADPGPAIQLSTVTDCSELYQQQLDGIASVTAYTFVNVRVP